MALTNFTLPFSGNGVAAANWATVSPIQHHATAVNNLLYNPDAHQKTSGLPDDPLHPYYKNDPYAPPTPNRQYRSRNNNYLPPPPPLPPSSQQQQPQPQQYNTPQPIRNFPQTQAPRPIYNDVVSEPQQQDQHLPAPENYLPYKEPQDIQPPADDTPPLYDYNAQRVTYDQTETPLPQIIPENTGSPVNNVNGRPVYTQVQAGVGSKTQVHAVLDYDNDDDEYYEDDDEHTSGKPGKKFLIFTNF